LRELCALYDVPYRVVLALIEVESKGNPYAIRVEPAYPYLWDVKKKRPFTIPEDHNRSSMVAPSTFHSLHGSRNTEWVGQKTSWGPMQVMGAVAREYGFEGWFPELCGDPGVQLGIIHFSRLYRKYESQWGWQGAAAAYNAGSAILVDGKFKNQQYVDKVEVAYAKVGG